MSPAHANKQGARYRYYVSQQLQDGTADAKGPGQRIPAVALEGLIVRRIRQQLGDPATILGIVHRSSSPASQKRLIERARQLADRDDKPGPDSVRGFVRSVVVRVQIHAGRIELTQDQGRLIRWLEGKAEERATVSHRKVRRQSQAQDPLDPGPAQASRQGDEDHRR